MKNLFKSNDSLLDLIVGIVVFGVLAELTSVWFIDDKLNYSLGLLFGVIIAIFMAWHMAYVLECAVDLDEVGATKKMQGGSFLRYGVVLVLFGLMLIVKIGNPLSAFLGIMGLKVSAYLAPFTHKIIRR